MPRRMLALLRTRRFAPLFWTQLLGAFNDNLLKSALVVALTFGAFRRGDAPEGLLVNLATALLVLPFFLFGSLAGQLADRSDKARLARWLKRAEIGAMSLALVGFLVGSVPTLFVALFLMGAQSAFFGPIKYALLPQHLREGELVAGNALVEAGTFLAILGGTLAGALLVGLPGVGVPLVGVVIVALAVGGTFCARRIPAAPPSADAAPVDPNLLRGTRSLLRVARRDRQSWRAVLGMSAFWLAGAVVLGQLPALAEQLQAGEGGLTTLLAAFTFGIGVGSYAAERLSGGRVDLGWVPVAAAALASLTVALPHAGSLASTAAILFALGVAGGLFAVPLMSLLQRRARAEERAQIIAANNVVNALFMTLGAGYAALRLGGGAGLEALFAELGLFLGIVAAAALALAHREAIRLGVAALVRVVYRVDARGLAHLPEEGPALLVANHLSFVDAFVLGGLCPRPVRFVMDHRMARLPGLGWLFRLCRVIPIAPAKEDPALLERAFAEIDAALAAGEVVGIFPEGKCTRDGEVDVFRPGVERILAARPVPVVPVALDGLWGSFFSYAHGLPMRFFPRRFRSRVRVRVGAPVDAALPAGALRDRVLALRADR